MTDENHNHPLAPATLFIRSDEETAAAAEPWDRREHQTSKCLVYILVWIVVQTALALILALIIFRIETPKFRLDNVIVQSLQYSTSSSAPSLNATLVAEVALKNDNFGLFKFQNKSTVGILYEGVPVSENAAMVGTRVKGRSTKRVNVTIEVRSDILFSRNINGTRYLTDDMEAGVVSLRSHAVLRGKVEVMGIVRRRKTPEMNCTFTLHLSSEKVQDIECR